MLKRTRISLLLLALALTMNPSAFAHFIWMRMAPSPKPSKQPGSIQIYFNEEPHPEAPEFLKYVKNLRPTVQGLPLNMVEAASSMNATWLGQLPSMVDAESDLGVMARGAAPHRLFYTARAQSKIVKPDHKETGAKLRVRLIDQDGTPMLQVLFDGALVPNARVKVYAEGSEPTELKTNDQGVVAVPGLADGKCAVWANWNDTKPGELDGKSYSETRYYATLTFQPTPSNAGEATRLAELPEPAVNSFGGAVLGDWLYVYSGHIGTTHKYSAATTSKHFRRLNLIKPAAWEDLPLDGDLQGVALVTDGKSLYRTGGMVARNAEGEEHDLHSVADCARFDPETKTWTKLPSMPEARSTHDAVIIGRTLYVVGGWTMNGAAEESEFCTTALALDLDHCENGWRVFSQPFQRRALAAGEHQGKLAVIAGLTDTGMTIDQSVDLYDPSSGAWSKGPALPKLSRTEGFGPSAITVDGRLYASGSSGTILRLTEDGKQWEPIGAWVLPRLTHRILPGPNHTLLAVGGNSRGEQTPVIESISLVPPAKTAVAAGR